MKVCFYAIVAQEGISGLELFGFLYEGVYGRPTLCLDATAGPPDILQWDTALLITLAHCASHKASLKIKIVEMMVLVSNSR
ncbi:hypothetical protein Ancab_026285 [Ancistrocladus abbreviatus]